MTARILVVDDLAPNVRVLEAKLSAEYFDVISANSGPEGIKKAESEVPDLIILDVMMPGMDGFETCRQLRQNPKTRHIPVVMLTALTEVQDRVRGLEAGADDFLSKPVNDVALFARVRSLIRLKMLMDELRTRRLTHGLDETLEAPDAGDTGAGRILLVEAHEHSAKRLKSYLEGVGHVIEVADNSEEAITKARREDFDLAITAIDLGGEDGLRLCGQFRSHEPTRQLPLLLTLEDDDLPRLAKGLDLGVTDYVVKPIDRNELAARVRTQIRRRRYHDQLRAMVETSVSMAFVDPLTGAYNRRYMMAHLERKIAELATNGGKPLSVMMLDVDHFKRINDTYGHAAGDEVLKEIVRRINASTRDLDLLARFGGEEFALIMPDTSEQNALSIGERLRLQIGDASFDVPNSSEAMKVTISIGITSTTDSEQDSGQLLAKADTALYAAKQTGRNRAVPASTIDLPPPLAANG